MRLKKLLFIFLFILPYPIISQNGEMLHYTETTGFNHNTSQESQMLFEAIAQDLGLSLVQDADGSAFDSLSNLQRFELVIFSNTSGNQGLDATQRANFEQYIADGGSYLGIHAASDTYRHSSANGSGTGAWDWYAETVCGASVQKSPNHTANNHPGTLTFLEQGGLLSQMLPISWDKEEEYYYWEKGYLSPDFVPLLEVGSTGNQSYDEPRMVAHYRTLPGGGKAFYTSLGHSGSNFDQNQLFGQLMKNAVEWSISSTILLIEFEKQDLLRKYRASLQNPSNGDLKFFIYLEKPIPLEMEIYDVLGNKLYNFIEENPGTGNWVWTPQIHVPKGLYHVLVHSRGKGILTKKLWIQ